MDARTIQISKALDGTAVELLFLLLERPDTEKGLVERAGDVAQPHAHKRLARLAEAGIINRDHPSRGAAWVVTAPDETRALLTAFLDLGDALESADRQVRRQLRNQLGGSPPDTRLRVMN